MTAHNLAIFGSCKNLSDLCDVINSADSESLDAVDFSDLPTFGGDVPADTTGIYSWDQDCLLVSVDGGSQMRIINRPDSVEAPAPKSYRIDSWADNSGRLIGFKNANPYAGMMESLEETVSKCGGMRVTEYEGTPDRAGWESADSSTLVDRFYLV